MLARMVRVTKVRSFPLSGEPLPVSGIHPSLRELLGLGLLGALWFLMVVFRME